MPSRWDVVGRLGSHHLQVTIDSSFVVVQASRQHKLRRRFLCLLSLFLCHLNPGSTHTASDLAGCDSRPAIYRIWVCDRSFLTPQNQTVSAPRFRAACPSMFENLLFPGSNSDEKEGTDIYGLSMSCRNGAGPGSI